MRHLGSIVLALLLASATWVLTGVGISKFAEARADSVGFGVDLAVGLAAILGAGACYALLILPRLSPLGLVLAGLGMLGLVVLRVADLDQFNRLVPADFLNMNDALRIPADGYAALLALPLLGTMFSPRRWRRDEYPPVQEAIPITPAYQAAPGYPAAQEYPLVPGMPTAGYPPQPYQSSGGGGTEDPTWPFPNDSESTRRL
jgi:hypothetical protein